MRLFAGLAVLSVLVPPWHSALGDAATSVTGPPVHECDRLAGDPRDPDRVTPGVPVPKMDGERALAACRAAEAAHPGSARFAYHMGRAFHALNDYGNAAVWFQKAAAAEYPPAMSILGVFYAAGGGLPQSYREAVRWYRRGAAKGYSVAMYNLAVRYADGQGVEKRDHAKAAHWFEQAAGLGHIGAMEGLAFIHLRGETGRRDFAQAARWFEKAASRGRLDPMYQLGWAYDSGRGVAADGKRAARWFLRALKAGHGRTLHDMTSERNLLWSDATRSAVQLELKSSGHYKGSVDGRFNSETLDAVRAYAGRF